MSRGFSLLETILSAFVLSLITMAVFNIFPSSVMAVKRGEMELEADSLAQQHLEQSRAQPFSQLVSIPALDPVTIAGTTFRPSLLVSDVPGSDSNHLKAVEVRVNWSFSQKNYTLVRAAWIVDVEN